ncbi:hypothetical protein ABEH27_22925 [Pseudomonas sp. P39-UII1]|uniref:hypothetical protein n=1 Tax=Pseudomonas sp. P39-UII1 TaxID=3080333 RepID=UPI003209984E
MEKRLGEGAGCATAGLARCLPRNFITNREWQLERRATLLFFVPDGLSIFGGLKKNFTDLFLTFPSG